MEKELRRMAEEAGFFMHHGESLNTVTESTIEAFARLVAADCVKLCLQADEPSAPHDNVPIGAAIDLIEAKYPPAD